MLAKALTEFQLFEKSVLALLGSFQRVQEDRVPPPLTLWRTVIAYWFDTSSEEPKHDPEDRFEVVLEVVDRRWSRLIQVLGFVERSLFFESRLA